MHWTEVEEENYSYTYRKKNKQFMKTKIKVTILSKETLVKRKWTEAGFEKFGWLYIGQNLLTLHLHPALNLMTSVL